MKQKENNQVKVVEVEAVEFELDGIFTGALSLVNLDDFEVSGRTINNIFREFKHLKTEELLLNLPNPLRVDEDVVIDMGRKISTAICMKAVDFPMHAEVAWNPKVNTGKPSYDNIVKRLIAYIIRVEGYGKRYQEWKRTVVAAARNAELDSMCGGNTPNKTSLQTLAEVHKAVKKDAPKSVKKAVNSAYLKDHTK